MRLKPVVLISSIIGTILLYVVFNTFTLGICNATCGPYIEKYQNIFLFFPIVLLFSILTYKSDAIFRYWWAFAKYGIPITLLLITAINVGVLNSPTQGSFGWGSIINNAVDFWASVIIYAVFVVGSLIQIGRGYFRKV